MGCSCVTLVQSAVRRERWSLWGPPPFPWELLLSSILVYLLEFCCLCWPTYLAGPDLDSILKLACRPAALLQVWVAVTGACFTLAAVSDQLCAFCSGTVGLCPVAVRSCLCLPCHAQLRAACLSCCSLTLSLNSLQLWQPWGQFCDAD